MTEFRIQDLSVRGFKSIVEKQSIKISPLTILAGANNSGKSAIIQPLLLLKQSIEASFDPGALYLSGPLVTFTSADQFLSRSGARGDQFEIEIGFAAEASLKLNFRKKTDQPIDIVKQTWTDDDKTYSLTADTPGVVRDRCFLRRVVEREHPAATKLHTAYATHAPISLLSGVIQQVLHIPGIRGNPERTYPVTGIGPNFPGNFQHYVGSIIASWQSTNSSTYGQLNTDLECLGLTPGVMAKRLTESEIDLLVHRIESNGDDLVSVADVGLGISHVLPVLVALRTAVRHQLVHVEEPEIHLHPRAQVRFADIIADAAKRDVKVVIETHSSLLLRAIQTLIAKGDLAPKTVGFYWFTRDSQGVTHIRSATPDENGAFGDWPEDFGDVALQSEKDYLDAVETKMLR